MKKILSLSLLFVLFLSGCIYYRSTEIAVVTDESINTIVKYKPLVLLGKNLYSEPKRIDNLKVNDGVITGNLSNYSGRYLNRGRALITAIYIPVCVILCFAENLLLKIGQDPETAKNA